MENAHQWSEWRDENTKAYERLVMIAFGLGNACAISFILLGFLISQLF